MLLERESLPRRHVGESLIPAANQVLDRLLELRDVHGDLGEIVTQVRLDLTGLTPGLYVAVDTDSGGRRAFVRR